MNKVKRLLSCRRPESQDISTENAFKECTSSFGFLNKKSDIPIHRSAVIPFCIVTDSTSIIGLANAVGNLDVGFGVAVKKTGWGPFMKSGYQNLIFKTTVKGFISLYEGADVRQGDMVKPLSKKDFHVVETGHAVYSVDSRQVFPLYFIHLNPDSSTRLPQVIKNVGVVPLDKNTLCDPTVLARMPVVSRQVSTLIGAGYLDLPGGKEKQGF